MLLLRWSDYTKGPECVKLGARCHKKCSSLRRNKAVPCQRQNYLICNHCNSSAGDRERCSVCWKCFRLHQYRAICNVCSSPCHLACNQLPLNDRDKLKTGDGQRSCCSHCHVTSQPPKSFSSPSLPMVETTGGCSTCGVLKRSIRKCYP